MAIIEKIKNEINSQRLTVRRLAELSNLNKNTVNNLSINTTLDSVLKIISGLGKHPCDFFCEDKSEKNVVSEPIVSYETNFKEKYIQMLEENRVLRIELDGFKSLDKPYKKIKLK
jgi:hypothetical protein